MTDKIRVVSYIDEKTYKKLTELCIKDRRKMSSLIALILDEYCKK